MVEASYITVRSLELLGLGASRRRECDRVARQALNDLGEFIAAEVTACELECNNEENKMMP